MNETQDIGPIILSQPAPSTQELPTAKNTLLKKIDVIFEWCLYGFVFLMPLFFLPGTSDVLELNKQLLLFIGTFVLALLVAAKIILTEKISYRPTLVYIGFGTLLLGWLLASIFSFYPYTSFVGIEKQEFISFVTIFCSIIFACLLINTLSKELILKTALSFLASMTLVIAIGLLQLWSVFILPFDFTKSNTFNTVGLTNLWGGVIAVALLVSLTGLLYLSIFSKTSEKTKQILSILLSVFTALSIICLIIIGNWHIWMSVLVGTLFLLGFLFAKLPRNEKVLWLLLPSFVAAISLILMFFAPPRIVALPLNAQPTFQTSLSIALQELKRSPLFGTGPGTYFSSYNQFRPKELNNINLYQLWRIRFDQSGSLGFTLLSSLGIIGILGLLVFVALFLYKVLLSLIKNKMSDEYLLLLGTMSAVITIRVLGVFEPGNMTLQFLFWLGVGIATYLTASALKTAHDQHKNRFLLVSSLALYLILSLGAIGIFFTLKRQGAEIAYANALVLDQKLSGIVRANQKIDSKEVDTLVKHLTVAVQKNPSNHTFLRVLSQALLYKVTDLSQTKESLTQNKATIETTALMALDTAKRAVFLNPHDVRNLQNAATTAKALIPYAGQNTEAMIKLSSDYFKKSLELDPTNPEIHIEAGKFSLDLAADRLQKIQQAKDDATKKSLRTEMDTFLSDAEKYLTTAKNLKEDYAPSYYYLGLILAQRNQKEDAIINLNKATQLNARLGVRDADPFLFYLAGLTYASLGEKERALDSYLSATIIKPDYQLSLWQLALMRNELGKKEDALKTLEQLLTLDPDNKIIQDKIKEIKEGKLTASPVPTPTPTPAPVLTGSPTPTPTPNQKTPQKK